MNEFQPTLDGSARPLRPQSTQRHTVPAPPLAQPTAPVGIGRLGRYQLLRELGRGGMGAVYEAFDPATQRNVAIKVILGDKANPRVLARFKLEARITAMLEHPSIVPAHDVGEAGGKFFMVMKLVRGKTFKDLVLKGKVDEHVLARSLDAFRKLCDAVAFMHSKGIIHRDLKPDNVMVGEHGEVQLMDMGICKIVGEPDTSAEDVPTLDKIERELPQLTMSGAIIGTPSYMSPEQARGLIDQLDARSDVYALGAILYFLLTANPPFPGKNAEAILKAVRAGHVKPPHELNRFAPPELESVTLRAMNPVQNRRYQSATELRVDVERFLAGECPQAHKDSILAATLRGIQRHPARSAGLAAAAVALLSAGTATALVSAAGSERQRAEVAAQAERTEKERARLMAEQARQRELIQAGRAEDLAKELGITVKAERDAALDSFRSRVEAAQAQGVGFPAFMNSLTNADIEAYLAGLHRTRANEVRTKTPLLEARDYLLAATVYQLGLGSLDRAEQSIHEALKLEPNRWTAYRGLASIANTRQDWKKAEAYARKALQLSKEAEQDNTVLLCIGLALYDAKKYAEALPWLERGLRLMPHSDGPQHKPLRDIVTYCREQAK